MISYALCTVIIRCHLLRKDTHPPDPWASRMAAARITQSGKRGAFDVFKHWLWVQNDQWPDSLRFQRIFARDPTELSESMLLILGLLGIRIPYNWGKLSTYQPNNWWKLLNKPTRTWPLARSSSKSMTRWTMDIHLLMNEVRHYMPGLFRLTTPSQKTKPLVHMVSYGFIIIKRGEIKRHSDSTL